MAVLPPAEALEELATRVDAASAASAAALGRAGRRGLFRRHGSTATLDRPAAPAAMTPLPVESLHLPIGTLGNLTRADTVALTDVLGSGVSACRRPVVRFSGGIIGEFRGTNRVWVGLDGDVDDLLALGREVPAAARRLGFLMDRRALRPWMPIGTVATSPDPEALRPLLASLDSWHGRAWRIDAVSLMARSSASPAGFSALQSLPLGRP